VCRGGVSVGQHIRRIGEDIKAGTRLFREGDHLGPRDIGVMAGIGLEAPERSARLIIESTSASSVDQYSWYQNGHGLIALLSPPADCSPDRRSRSRRRPQRPLGQ
jgi:hypothetical protein